MRRIVVLTIWVLLFIVLCQFSLGSYMLKIDSQGRRNITFDFSQKTMYNFSFTFYNISNFSTGPIIRSEMSIAPSPYPGGRENFSLVIASDISASMLDCILGAGDMDCMNPGSSLPYVYENCQFLPDETSCAGIDPDTGYCYNYTSGLLHFEYNYSPIVSSTYSNCEIASDCSILGKVPVDYLGSHFYSDVCPINYTTKPGEFSQPYNCELIVDDNVECTDLGKSEYNIYENRSASGIWIEDVQQSVFSNWIKECCIVNQSCYSQLDCCNEQFVCEVNRSQGRYLPGGCTSTTGNPPAYPNCNTQTFCEARQDSFIFSCDSVRDLTGKDIAKNLVEDIYNASLDQHIGILEFNDDANVLQGFVELNRSTKVTNLHDLIDTLAPEKNTCLSCAIRSALDNFAAQPSDPWAWLDCDCSDYWVDAGCGGGCGNGYRRERCSIYGCTTQYDCIQDAACLDCDCTGQWTDDVCGDGTNGCAVGERIQNCDINGCTSQTQCVTDSSCAPACSCSGWSDLSCGAHNTCHASEMYQTRTCNPAGCNTSVRCQDTASCATPCEQNLFTFDYRYPQSGGYGRQYTSFRDPYHNILGGACIIPTGIVPPGAPAGTGGCWVNDHKFVWIKIHNPRGLYNAGFQFYGYFDGESGEDLRIIVNNDRSSAPYRDANLPIQTGWNWINMGRFMLQPGVNYIGMTNPLYEQEMADGQDDDLDGTSVHFGYFIFTCN